jgi:hypothetical protein
MLPCLMIDLVSGNACPRLFTVDICCDVLIVLGQHTEL